MDVLLTVTEEVEEALKARLFEVRKTSYWNALCFTDPEKWLKVALSVYRGDTVRSTMKNYSVAQTTYYAVLKQVLDIQEKYLEYQVSQLDANMDAVDEATSGMLELVHRSVGEMRDGEVDYDKAKTTESLSASLDRIQKSAISMSMRKNKLLDRPDVVVENRGPAIDYEARKEELLAMRKAEAIDVTED